MLAAERGGHRRCAGGGTERRAEQAGFHKLVGKLFADNEASRRLVARHGFHEVGTHRRHGRIDGEWRDVIVVELLLRPRG